MKKIFLVLIILYTSLLAVDVEITGNKDVYDYLTVFQLVSTNSLFTNNFATMRLKNDNEFKFRFGSSVSQTQTNELYSILSNTGWTELEFNKIKAVVEMKNDFEDFMAGRYNIRKQIGLLSIYLLGLDKEKTNRTAYASTGFEWLETGFDLLYSNVSNIMCLTNLNDVKDYEYSWDSLITTDPQLDISIAKEYE